ncbi:biopolymer transporter ExbD [Blastopirellula marina]|uniref:Biopolymer transporter ExbD n=1 Tax=Blastopirellula marina TaxID=124 RepID=A0A2S8F3N2_9BACT|nr:MULTISPECIES: biopolymer transporter ExbD [Pirellulaceae]PQO26727.1 biopolymer transporter ExbD [Blastopirellula marina]RCS46206.1 biopolymer transporter ExbD [Bremerella cremea]
MKIKKKKREMLEGDLTPMIDMTFQLIAFFMVLINFTQADQNKKIQLPQSELAKPPEIPFENAITLQMYQDGLAYFDGNDYTFDALRQRLVVEKQIADDFKTDAGGAKGVTVIIRGDGRVATGKVQEMIKLCQDVGFEKFALRAKEEAPNN